MIIENHAYPRAALIGNPSDGYYGKTIAFVFRNYSASVLLYESPELMLQASSRDQNNFNDLKDLNDTVGKYGYYGGIRLLKAAARQFYNHCLVNGIKLDKRNFTIRYESNIPNRLGLAGSSAIITAAIRSMCDFYDVKISDAVLANVVLAAERDELSIPAGLQDRVAQAYNHPVFMDFNREQMEKFGFGSYEKITIPSDLKLYVAYRTDLAEGSEILHSRLRDDYNSKVPSVLAAMEEWSSLTLAVKEALASRDFEAIPELLNRNFDLRCEVCAGAVSEKNRRMVDIARKCGASAKFTGSGGAIIGTYVNDVMFDRLKEELNRYSVEIIKPEIVCGGE